MRFFLGIGFLLIALVGCQKVIDVPLNDADQQIIVEAVLKDSPGNNYILLSKSGSVYKESSFEKITDALVKVVDEDGVVTIFEHQENGRYYHSEFEIIPGKRYDLEVEVGENRITSTCQTRTKPTLDSLSVYPISGQFGVAEEDTVYLVSFHSVDNVDEENYYLLKIFRNGEPNTGYYLGNDDFINGQYYEAQFFGSEADPGDTVFVEMISMDGANYDYYIGLANNLSQGPFSAAPANPPSNLEGNALGFFGAYTTDTLGLILP